MEQGNERAKLAWNMRTYQITKYIGGFIAALGGLDAIVFTAGIGENQEHLRSELLHNLEYLGVQVDEEKNLVHGVEREITTPDSTVRGFVIPTMRSSSSRGIPKRSSSRCNETETGLYGWASV